MDFDLLLSQLQGLYSWVVISEAGMGRRVVLFRGRLGSGVLFWEPLDDVKTVPRRRSRLGRKEKLGRSM